MRLKIVGNSHNPKDIKFVDVETNSELVGVVHAEIHIDPFDVKAILILDDFDFDLETESLVDESSTG